MPSKASVVEHREIESAEPLGVGDHVDRGDLPAPSRGLMEGDAAAGDIAIVLAVAAGLTAVFAPLTTRLYYRRS